MRIVDVGEAQGLTKEVGERIKDPQTCRVSMAMKILGLLQEAMGAVASLNRAIMFGQGSSLTRPEREMVSVVVSTIN
ncbi:MAG: hypothetical protein ACK4K2_01240 [Dehalococcoidia bacterium]